tara:strand:- start:60 stop:284 length:225 start_codon:yes stop_codon:yes gene_type:complete
MIDIEVIAANQNKASNLISKIENLIDILGIDYYEFAEITKIDSQKAEDFYSEEYEEFDCGDLFDMHYLLAKTIN